MQFTNILNVLGMGKHVNWLDSNDFIFSCHHCQIPCLGGRIATDIDNALRGGVHYDFNDVRMHAGTGRVHYHNIRTTVFRYEIRREHVLHITGKEGTVVYPIGFGIDAGIFDGLGDIFDPDYPGSPAAHELGDCAGAGIEVIDNFISL